MPSLPAALDRRTEAMMERFRLTVAAIQTDGQDSPIARIERIFIFDPSFGESWDSELDVVVGDIAEASRKLVEAVSVVRVMVPDC